MPIVEYKCEHCENEFDEIVLSFSNVENELKCPKCEKTAVKRDFPSSHGFNGTYLANCRK